LSSYTANKVMVLSALASSYLLITGFYYLTIACLVEQVFGWGYSSPSMLTRTRHRWFAVFLSLGARLGSQFRGILTRSEQLSDQNLPPKRVRSHLGTGQPR